MLTWLYWRRPLLLLLILSSTISLLVTGQFSLHVVGSTAIYWSIVPLAEIAALAAAGRKWPDAKTVDGFFKGFVPWLVFLIALAAIGVGVTPAQFWLWLAVAVAVILWSGWSDYRFLDSAEKLILHRAVSWSIIAVVFAGSWLWMRIAQRLGV